MSDEFAQYEASNYKRRTAPHDEFAQYEATNYPLKKKPNPAIDEAAQLQQQHPILYKIAEALQGSPAIEKAGNIAGQINRFTEMSGLPSMARGALGSGVEMGRGVANLIPGVNIPHQNLQPLHVHPIGGDLMEAVGSLGMAYPALGAYNVAKRGIESLPYAKKVPELIRNILAGTSTGAALSPDNRKIGAALGGAFEAAPYLASQAKKVYESFSPKTRMKQLMQSMLAHEREAAELAALQSEAKDLYKTQDPEKLLKSAAEKEAELQSALAFKKHHFGEEHALPGRQHPEEFEHGLESTKQETRNLLGEGEPHTEEFSQKIVDAMEGLPVIEPHPETGLPRQVRKGGLREEIGSKYDKLSENLPEVEIPNVELSQEIEKEMKKFVSSGSALNEKEKQNMRDLLLSTHPGRNQKMVTMSGKKFFNAYRSMKRLEGEQRSKAFSGLDPKSHDEWIERANETNLAAKEMEAIIEKYFPKDTIKRLHEINHEYSTKIAPLHENPTYQQMLNHGKYEGNLIKALSGTTKGNPILNAMVHSDPELARLLIGKEFAHQPEKLIKPNKRLERYTQINPEISRLIEQQKQFHGGLEHAITRQKLFKEIEHIPTLTKDIKAQRKLADEIKTQLERADLTKTQRSKKELELKESERKSNKLTRKAIRLGLGLGAGAYLGNKLLE